MGRLFRKPSPAMVVACLALMIALSGTGYAVSQLPRNSVGTLQLKNDAVVGSKVKKDSLTGADVNEMTLNGFPVARFEGTPCSLGAKQGRVLVLFETVSGTDGVGGSAIRCVVEDSWEQDDSSAAVDDFGMPLESETTLRTIFPARDDDWLKIVDNDPARHLSAFFVRSINRQVKFDLFEDGAPIPGAQNVDMWVVEEISAAPEGTITVRLHAPVISSYTFTFGTSAS